MAKSDTNPPSNSQDTIPILGPINGKKKRVQVGAAVPTKCPHCGEKLFVHAMVAPEMPILGPPYD